MRRSGRQKGRWVAESGLSTPLSLHGKTPRRRRTELRYHRGSLCVIQGIDPRWFLNALFRPFFPLPSPSWDYGRRAGVGWGGEGVF